MAIRGGRRFGTTLLLLLLALVIIAGILLVWGIREAISLHAAMIKAENSTFQVDAVVGHAGDSRAHPSHFIVTTRNGHIIIIEYPAGNARHSISYVVPYSVDQNGSTPVTLSFIDDQHTGKADMILRIGNTQFVFLNDGIAFRLERYGLHPRNHSTVKVNISEKVQYTTAE